MRQSDAACDADASAVEPDIETVDTAALPDVNTGLPTVCSSASITSSTETTDNDCECTCLVRVILCQFTMISVVHLDLASVSVVFASFLVNKV